ncbi:hypothetical protein [Flavobacterium haoranii]|uniref:Uncharacterized protein n=1 Tax=Flavobacterium haoranii TaxID=683124 RepID=A0A1M6H553_9FLAO|nr:hypothetical protein [Flavobacterium haoranii]SHJ17333.1 hypothetical protein SAMN05444337_1433 [Flavobacterium haoranii]
MIEFDFTELNLLNKLLNKVKYTELDSYDLNQFANSPITNRIMEKIQTEFKPLAEKTPRIHNNGIPKFEFKLENYVGKAITNRLEHMDLSSFRTIAEWDKSQTEKFAKDILGIIDFEESELNKLTEYITEKAKEKTSG